MLGNLFIHAPLVATAINLAARPRRVYQRIDLQSAMVLLTAANYSILDTGYRTKRINCWTKCKAKVKNRIATPGQYLN